MKLSFFCKISGVSLFRCGIHSDSDAFTIGANISTPFLSARMIEAQSNAHEARPIVCMFAYVMLLLNVANQPKIAPSVVVFVAIYVIYGLCRPFAGHIKKRKAMRKVGPPVYADFPIATTTPGDTSDDAPTAELLNPSK